MKLSLVERSKSYRQILCLGVVIDLSIIAQFRGLCFERFRGYFDIGIGSTLEIQPSYAIVILLHYRSVSEIFYHITSYHVLKDLRSALNNGTI